MHFRTELSVNKSLLQFHHRTPFLTIGSCFSEEIGQLLEASKFNVLNNPFGTMFNPISIAKIIQGICRTTERKPLPILAGDVWLDYRFHSSIYGYSEKELKETIDQKFQQASDQLSQPNSVFVITLGTAWVYRLLSENCIVANCHKQSYTLFQKELSSLEEQLHVFKEALNLLFENFPHCQVILTLSPVRHTKDGLEENQISKSSLRLLCHQLNSAFPQLHYFPSYEIILDDLRDYRFYSKDLVHPNEQAVNYIWEKFRHTFFDKHTDQVVHQWMQIRQNLLHKPFYEKGKAYKKFMEQTLQDLEHIHHKIDVTKEIEELKQTIQRHA
ncbi:MAG: GSCFA domain-containing protein [Cytophagaceae bacterium]|nr:GSCFA domain-containing protein [Cytophagaceae bacterium]